MKIWSILRPFDILYGHLVYFVVKFGMFFSVLVCCTKKNLATLTPAGWGTLFFRNASKVSKEAWGKYFSNTLIGYNFVPGNIFLC
jgi:hypothetical protein